MDVSLESLTLAELAKVKDKAGKERFDEFMAGGLEPSAMQAVAWVMLLRDDPDATFEQAGDVKVTDFRAVEMDPTNGGD